MNEEWQERMAEKEEEMTRMGGSCLGGWRKGGKEWTGKKKGSMETCWMSGKEGG